MTLGKASPTIVNISWTCLKEFLSNLICELFFSSLIVGMAK